MMAFVRPLPSPEYLQARLRYDPDSGRLYWRESSAMPGYWNTKWAGREAFTTTMSNGYRQGAVDNRLLYAHRVIWAIIQGEWPQGQVDHVNHDRTDNRIANLRAVSHRENGCNQKLGVNNTSGARGVHFRKDTMRWSVRITIHGVSRNLGCYSTFEEALAARRVAEAAHDFHPNHGMAA